MIRITVKDLAVVEYAEIEFNAGLNTVTGETGAGKSVLIGAIDLLTGGRADKSAIRHGAAQAIVTAEIDVSPDLEKKITPILEEADISPCEGALLLLKRTISSTGAGRCSVNSCPATAGVLAKLGAHLVDMHGPHDNQSLLNQSFQLDAIDSYGQCQKEREEFSLIWEQRKAKLAEREELFGSAEATERELDILKYQVEEIAAAKLSEDDGEPLISEYTEASNAARIIELANGAMAALTDDQMAATNSVAAAIRLIDEMNTLGSSNAKDWSEEAKSISIQISELAKNIADVASRLDISPDRIQWLEDRVNLVERLKSKYGKTHEAVLDFYEKGSARLAELSSRGERAAKIDAEIEALSSQLKAAGAKLHEKRSSAAKLLAKAVSKELSDLGIAQAAFTIELKEGESATGFDVAEFGFTPNLGEPERPLRMIASSGEISRVMLALKTSLAEHDQIPILVFDEIDANIGGEIAHTVGKKLAHVAKTHLVICITHLPQVAACGTTHFAVAKSVADGRTSTHIDVLSQEERVEELVRMLGGAGLTSVTKDHARELLSSAH